MAIKPNYIFKRVPYSIEKRGFALLIAVIFMSVMLTFGIALSSLAYKQHILSSSALESQYAFYAADAGLECALYADQQKNTFAYQSNPSSAPTINCDGAPARSVQFVSHTLKWVVSERFSLDSNTHCADITVYKPKSTGTTYIFSQGYNVSCSVVSNPNSPQFVVRGLKASY